MIFEALQSERGLSEVETPKNPGIQPRDLNFLSRIIFYPDLYKSVRLLIIQKITFCGDFYQSPVILFYKSLYKLFICFISYLLNPLEQIRMRRMMSRGLQ